MGLLLHSPEPSSQVPSWHTLADYAESLLTDYSTCAAHTAYHFSLGRGLQAGTCPGKNDVWPWAEDLEHVPSRPQARVYWDVCYQ